MSAVFVRLCSRARDNMSETVLEVIVNLSIRGLDKPWPAHAGLRAHVARWKWKGCLHGIASRGCCTRIPTRRRKLTPRFRRSEGSGSGFENYGRQYWPKRTFNVPAPCLCHKCQRDDCEPTEEANTDRTFPTTSEA